MVIPLQVSQVSKFCFRDKLILLTLRSKEEVVYFIRLRVFVCTAIKDEVALITTDFEMSSPGHGKGKNKKKSKGRGDRGRGRGNNGQAQLPTPGRSGGATKYPDEKEVLSEEIPKGASCPVEKTVPGQSSSSAEEKPVSGPSRSPTSKEKVPAEPKPEQKTHSVAEEGELEKPGPSHSASSKGKTPAKGGKTKQQPAAPSQGKQPSSSPAGTKGILRRHDTESLPRKSCLGHAK